MSANNAKHVLPPRNLPGSSEAWGRALEDMVKRLDRGYTIVSSGMGALNQSMSGQFAMTAQQEAAIQYAESLADRARVSADGKSTVWRSPEQPEGTDHAVGDTWFDESDGNKIYTWDGEKWEDVFLGFDAFSQDVNSKIDDAFSTAFEALDDALQAQTSADGKNSVHYGSVAPPGTSHKIWDTWFDSSNGNRINEWNGSTWVPAEIGTNAIGNNAITNAKIANLDAAKITSGEIDADRIGARTISVENLLVTSLDNLAENPGFEATSGPTGWTTLGLSSITTNFPRSGSRALSVPTQSGIYVAAMQNSWSAIEPREQYRVSAWVRPTDPAAGFGISLRFQYSATEGGTPARSPYIAWTTSGTSGEYVKISGVWEVPTSTQSRFARLEIVSRDITLGRTYYVDDVEVAKMTTGSMIVDGAITADSAIIANGAISSAQIADLAVTNAKIANGTIQYAKIGSVDAGTISVGTLDAARIAANSISAAKISGGDFAGKTFSGGIFTGSTIRTAASGARVQLDAVGLRTFNSSGTESARLTAETGGLSIGTSNGTSKLNLNTHNDYAITSTASTVSDTNSAMAFSIADRRTVGSQKYYAAHVAQTGLGSGAQGQAILSLTEFTNNTVQADLRTAGAASLFVTSSNGIGVYADAGVAVRANNSSAASLSSRGGQVSVAALNTAGTSVTGQVGIASNGRISLLGQASADFVLGKDDSARIWSAAIYNRTYSGASNLYITPAATLGRSTSSRRYKLDEQVVDVLDYEDSLLSIDFKSWIDKRQNEERSKLEEYREENPYAPVPPQFADLESFDEPVRHIGAVSEDFMDAGLPEFVIYNDKGEPDGLQYDRVGVALIPIIRRLKERVDSLESQLSVVQ